jgi:hypothetical protein
MVRLAKIIVITSKERETAKPFNFNSLYSKMNSLVGISRSLSVQKKVGQGYHRDDPIGSFFDGMQFGFEGRSRFRGWNSKRSARRGREPSQQARTCDRISSAFCSAQKAPGVPENKNGHLPNFCFNIDINDPSV